VGRVLDDFRVAAAARNPPEPFSFLAVCRVEVSGAPILPELSRAAQCPIAALLPAATAGAV
jgi:hypothetical protein